MHEIGHEGVLRTIGLVLALLLTLAAFVPLGVYMQWVLPNRFSPVCVLVPGSILLLILSAYAYRRSRTADKHRWPKRIGALCLLVMSVLVVVATSVPVASRRIGPWAVLHDMLVEASCAVRETRAALSIPEGRSLTRSEMDQIERLALEPVPSYSFPIVNRCVEVRIISGIPPYVGVDFCDGRRVVFDLDTMFVLYAD